ncbi:hypothetical protein GCM10023107_77830 [Actinoplanes octamycinicus]|nr:hypothetical protein Aoc01nite_62470 [Actinoplanes octamycinicus]
MLPSDLVSRRHAVIRSRGDRFEIEDLGSSNGTRVNGAPIHGTHPLRPGDQIELADTRINFSYAGEPPAESESLRQELRQAPGFGVRALFLAVAGSVVGTVIPAALNSGSWGTLAGATIGPVISTVFSTKYTGEKGRVRVAAIVLLSVAALVITVTGFTLGDKATGGSVVPGAGDRTGTFPDLIEENPGKGGDPDPAPTDPAVVELSAVRCGSATVGESRGCPIATVRYHGPDRLHVTGVEMRGDAAGDFTAGGDCADRWLDPEEACEMTVTFRPSAEGDRSATLVVHQNLPSPEDGTTAQVTGTGTAGSTGGGDECLSGFVWREAIAGDHVCVPPETRDQARADNAAADSRRSPTGGDYGPDTCLSGYIWRLVTPSDLVCVTPETHDQVEEDNSLAASRRAG